MPCRPVPAEVQGWWRGVAPPDPQYAREFCQPTGGAEAEAISNDSEESRLLYRVIIIYPECHAGQYQLRFECGGEEWRHLTDNVRWISASPEEEEEEESSAQSSSDNATSEVSEEARTLLCCP